MMKNKKRTTNISVFGSRVFDGCKTILQLGLRHSLIGLMIVSAGCNPSTTNYNQTIQQPGSSDPTKQSVQTGGPGSGGGGTGDGGGGQGVYCSETAKDSNIKGKLMVRDVYEAIKNHKRNMPSGKLGAGGTDKVDDASIKYLVEVLKAYFGPASWNLDFVNVEYWKKFSESISFIPDDATLHPSQDANSPLALPEGCKIVQIAYWDESSGPIEEGTLYVDKKSWKQLDQYNKVALLAHEFFFKQARKGGYKNSDFVRYKVGQLLSQEGLPAVFQQWGPSQDERVKDILPEKMTGFKYCKGSSENDPSARLQMYQYEGKDGLQHIVFPVVSSSTINLSDFQVAHVVFSPEKNGNVSFFTDLLFITSNFKDAIGSVNGSDFLRAFYDLALLSNRYGSETFIDTLIKDSVPSLQKKIIQSVSTLPLNNDVSWIVKSRSGSVKIQLNNPVVLRSEERVTKSLNAEQLTLAVNHQILAKIIGNVGVPNASDIVLPSLSILHKELDAGLAAGVYPKELPRWNTELKKIETLVTDALTKEFGAPKKFSIADKADLLDALPRKLYALKLNAYSEREILRGLDNANYKTAKDTPVDLRQGSISIIEGGNTATFLLECNDYTDLFKRKTQKAEYLEEAESVKLGDLRFIPDETSDSSESPRAANYLRYRDEFIKKFARNTEIEKKDINSSGGCGIDNKSDQFCFDLNSFFVDLRDESMVEMHDCLGYGISLKRRGEDVEMCGILDLKKSKQKYLVIFSYPYNENFLMSRSQDPGELFFKYILRIP